VKISPQRAHREDRRAALRRGARNILNHRVGGIAQSVPEEIERQNDGDDRHRGGEQPGGERQRLDVLRVLQQDAPTDRRRPQPEPEEAQRVSLMIIAGSARLVAAMM